MRTPSTTPTIAVSALLAVVLGALPGTSQTADFALIEKPALLTILNQYQEQMGAADKAAMGAHVPVQIVDLDATLGDQLTRALKCELGGNTMFLQRDENGLIAGTSSKTLRYTYRGATVLGDTMECAAGVTITARPDGSGAISLARGERVLRVFRTGGRSYCRRIGGSATYGWCGPETSLRPLKAATSAPGPDSSLAQNLKRRLEERVSEANDAYRDFWGHFNAATNQQKSVPSWKPDPASPLPRWTLSAPYHRTSELAESTRALVQELEGLLMGKPYAVSYAGGVLSVTSRGVTR